MNVRGFTEDTRRDYVRCVKRFAAFIGRPPDAATAENLRVSRNPSFEFAVCFQHVQVRAFARGAAH
jgi:hypothetical protein